MTTTNTNIKPGYKQSKLGLIPEDWEVKTLNEVCTLSNGKAFKQEELLKKGKYKVLRVGNFFTKGSWYFSNLDLDQNKYVENGDLMYAWSASFGPKYWEGTKTIYHYHIWKVQPNQLIKQEYLYQFFVFDATKLMRTKQGGTMFHITKGDMEKRKLPTPPLPEQEKIAAILSTWDSNIEKNQKLIEKLQARKKGLMQQLLTGKKRLKGFSGEWETVRLGDIAEQYSVKNKEDKEIEVLSCTKYNGLVRSLDYFGRQVFGNDLTKYKIVPKNYFAYATNHIEEGSLGYQDFLSEGLVSPMYTVFKTNSKIDDYYLFRVLKSERMIYNYQSNMSGSIARRGGLRWNAFETLTINLPKIEEQKAIENILNKADEEINHFQNYLEKLQAQKKGLMQVLLTGEIRVKC